MQNQGKSLVPVEHRVAYELEVCGPRCANRITCLSSDVTPLQVFDVTAVC